jgi:hypothetical protein
MLWGLLSVLLANTVIAGIGPQALYSRLAGQILNISGNMFSGGSAAYQVQPYGAATQNPGTTAHYSLGSFYAYQVVGGQYSYMLYTGGSAAGGCPYQRSLSLYINCGPTFNVTSVSEPVVCSYQLTIQVPEVCGINMAAGYENASASASFIPSPSSQASITPLMTASLGLSASASSSSSISSMPSSASMFTVSSAPSAFATGTAPGTASPTPSVTPTPAQGLRINVDNVYNMTVQTSNTITTIVNSNSDSSANGLVAAVIVEAVVIAAVLALGAFVWYKHTTAVPAKPLSATAPKMPIPPTSTPESKKVSWAESMSGAIKKITTTPAANPKPLRASTPPVNKPASA